MAARRTRNGDPTPLSKERVLLAAVALADERGIAALSMRTLAQELDAGTMSLYHHVPGKEALLSGMVDIVVREIEPPDLEGEWKPAIRRSVISFHDALRRHRWAADLMMTPDRVRPARLDYMDALLGRLRRAGFSADMTHFAYHALDSHIVGFALWQAGIATVASDLPDLAATVLQRLSVDEHPYLIEHIEQHLRPDSPDGRTEFEFGLDLILDGLERLREAA
ncbi:MAG: TetR/AcrR family transcriptional regulator [Chloroflexota bacterium]|nr:TetR/AcrR family transcriptional regulator [Chloroflexota bacterium]